MRSLEDKAFLVLVVAVSIAFVVVVWPFAGALLWAVILAIVFAPMKGRIMRSMPAHRNRAALLTLLVIIAAVIAPALVLAGFLIAEANSVYASLSVDTIDFNDKFRMVLHELPPWLNKALEPYGLTDFDAALTKLGNTAVNSIDQVAGQALTIGQSTLSFLLALGVMLYVTFFLLRDGEKLTAQIGAAVPLRPEQRRSLLDTFTTVIRATIKGSLVVAVLQGTLGGLIFWALDIRAALLWGVVMTVLAFLPVVGTGLVWAPVAIYLLATGSIWQGVVLILCGVFVIGLVDNVVRPILVGRDTRLPDWLVLVSTLGGLAVFGANGVIIGPVIAALFLAVWEIFAVSRAAGTMR